MFSKYYHNFSGRAPYNTNRIHLNLLKHINIYFCRQSQEYQYQFMRVICTVFNYSRVSSQSIQSITIRFQWGFHCVVGYYPKLTRRYIPGEGKRGCGGRSGGMGGRGGWVLGMQIKSHFS